MKCKQHAACVNNKIGNNSECDPNKDKGGSVCRQCCDDRTDRCNLDLYQSIIGNLGKTWDGNNMNHHTLPPTEQPVIIQKTKLWNGEVVAENDSRALAQKAQENATGR